MRLDKEVGTLNREIVAIKDKWKIALNIDSKKIAIEKLITLRKKLRDNREVSEKIEQATKEEDLKLNQQISQSQLQQTTNNSSFSSNSKVSAQKVTPNQNNIPMQQNNGFGLKDNRESLNEVAKINDVAKQPKQQINNKQNNPVVETSKNINQSVQPVTTNIVMQDNNSNKYAIASKNTANTTNTNKENPEIIIKPTIQVPVVNTAEIKETKIETIDKVVEDPSHLTVAWLKQRMKGK